MWHSVLVVLVVAGFLVTGFAATAVRAFQEFSRRELEIYCQRRRRLDRFGEILDDYEQVVHGAENLQVVGLILILVAAVGFGSLYLPQNGPSTSSVMSETLPLWLAAIAVVSCLAILCVTTWIPLAVTRLWGEAFLYRTWFIWKAVHQVLWPLTLGMVVIDALLHRLADRPRTAEDEEEAFEEEIRSIVTEGFYDGVLEEDTREMIEGVIELGDETVSHIMTPRSNIDALEMHAGWDEVLRVVVDVGRTRLPVYDDKLDNIVGVLYVKDLLRVLQPGKSPTRPWADLLREPWFVPTTKPLDEMLQEFLRTRKHLAIVVDEYMSVAGVVTIEDVLEEIVGEIVDESDKEEEQSIKHLDARTAEVLGITHVDTINEELGLQLPEPEDCDTIAGLVLSQLGRIPEKGEQLTVGDVRLTVLEASPRRVERLRIESQLEAPEPADA